MDLNKYNQCSTVTGSDDINEDGSFNETVINLMTISNKVNYKLLGNCYLNVQQLECVLTNHPLRTALVEALNLKEITIKTEPNFSKDNTMELVTKGRVHEVEEEARDLMLYYQREANILSARHNSFIPSIFISDNLKLNWINSLLRLFLSNSEFDSELDNKPERSVSKRTTLRFAPNIKSVLMQSFEKGPYPSDQERFKLSTLCKLSEHQINIWFANQRMRNKGFRKQRKDRLMLDYNLEVNGV